MNSPSNCMWTPWYTNRCGEPDIARTPCGGGRGVTTPGIALRVWSKETFGMATAARWCQSTFILNMSAPLSVSNFPIHEFVLSKSNSP